MLQWAATTSSRRTDEDGVDDDLETYLLLLLSDSNLPTGGFVASSGLESYHAHGLLHNVDPTSALARFGLQHAASSSSSASTSVPARSQRPVAPPQARLSSSTLSFCRSTLHSYARSAVPFLVRVHHQVQRYCNHRVRLQLDRNRRRTAQQNEGDSGEAVEEAVARQRYENEQDEADLTDLLDSIAWLDQGYHSLLLNHVARRASKAQGIALLTLYSKAFARPIGLADESFDGSRLGLDCTSLHDDAESIHIQVAADLVDHLKRQIRRSAAVASSSSSSGTSAATGAARATQRSKQQEGHFPICWAVFAACMDLSRTRTVQLHLFLQVRSILSSSIRLNTLGPYLAHQIMRFQLRHVVEQILDELRGAGCMVVSSDTVKLDVGQRRIEEGERLAPGPPESDDGAQVGEARSHPADEVASHPTPSSAPSVAELRSDKHLLVRVDDADEDQGWAWDWPEDGIDDYRHLASPYARAAVCDMPASGAFWNAPSAPATTYPLGEIVQARHDQLHSRLFNS
ncbi:hypothetical protein ACQY0O_007336 [Thecaphora frezii]